MLLFEKVIITFWSDGLCC